MDTQTYALMMGLDLAADEAPRHSHWSWLALGLTFALANVALVVAV